MTDNTQELDELMDKIYDLAYDHLPERGITIGTNRIKQAIIDWHNKHIEEALDRLAIEVRASDYIGIAETIQSERNKLTMANSPQLDKLKERDDE